jgi:amidophosphoribosyltransferase
MAIPEIGLVAFRDPRGIRPLCFGSIDSDGYAVSSESVAISDYCGEDIRAGECVIISDSGVQRKQIIEDAVKNPCLFEYIYFARPESTIDGILVYQARKNMGEALARKMLRDEPDLVDSIDVVMPVPDSGRISALRASYVLQKPYCEGLIRNNYVGRTFIMPSQTERKRSLKMKLNTIDQEFRDKTVLIIDDSIVRGNTSIQIVELVRKAGAKCILFASIAPPVLNPNVYGIAIPSAEELIASHNKTHDEIGKNAVLEEGGVRRITGDCLFDLRDSLRCAPEISPANPRNLTAARPDFFAQSKVIARLIGADKVVYNTLEDVVAACRKINPGIEGFETSCF